MKNPVEIHVQYSPSNIETEVTLNDLELTFESVLWTLIDFSKFGVPQKRTRFILVGIKNDFLRKKTNISKETFFDEIESNKDDFLILILK